MNLPQTQSLKCFDTDANIINQKNVIICTEKKSKNILLHHWLVPVFPAIRAIEFNLADGIDCFGMLLCGGKAGMVLAENGEPVFAARFVIGFPDWPEENNIKQQSECHQ